ncbi:Mitochondrial import receptor subunit TOM20 [Lachancea thermotolerans]|uniref:KLTH0F10912p n=1 Tax=Lachancea thermotolerans (strain ATCC 56472 / CBS 6340 / NRRL Y-8284) TaxID=559295 RepID=C5DL88_LACTC|nr:KLTH0F10912p [Lachancea thermotolerans CBS 6340]CAR24239.1 KLTH0F10912p [Lachancea thermotolerans CBS 6340]
MSQQPGSIARILAVTGLTATVAIAGYAAYFDYQRRNNPDFRKSLKRKLKKHAEEEKQAKERAKQQKLAHVGEYLTAELAKDPVSTDPTQREAVFTSNVELGERLASVAGNELESALKFYKALSVYPNPADLLGIYQRSVPEAVYEYIVLMIAIMPPVNVSTFLSGGAQGGPAAVAQAMAGQAGNTGAGVGEIDE